MTTNYTPSREKRRPRPRGCIRLENLPRSPKAEAVRADILDRLAQHEEAQAEGDAVEVIDVSAHEPRRIPSKKWRELIKKVWEADPLQCPKCSREMRIVSLID